MVNAVYNDLVQTLYRLATHKEACAEELRKHASKHSTNYRSEEAYEALKAALQFIVDAGELRMEARALEEKIRATKPQ